MYYQIFFLFIKTLRPSFWLRLTQFDGFITTATINQYLSRIDFCLLNWSWTVLGHFTKQCIRKCQLVTFSRTFLQFYPKTIAWSVNLHTLWESCLKSGSLASKKWSLEKNKLNYSLDRVIIILLIQWMTLSHRLGSKKGFSIIFISSQVKANMKVEFLNCS